MSKILTACPVTGHPLDTGVEIDEASFARLPTFVGTVFCSHCGTKHEWSREKAWVADRNKSKS